MKTPSPRLEAIRAAVQAAHAHPHHRWLADAGKALRPGQVWTVAGGCGDQSSWCWLLLDTLDQRLANLAPLSPWSELAGPDDLLIPLDDAAPSSFVSFELEATLGRADLGNCLGRLPAALFERILAARVAVGDPSARQSFAWGLGYFNTRGPRQIWHEAVAERLEACQAPVRQAIYREQPAPIMAFPVDLPWSAFASEFVAFPMRKAASSGKLSTPCLLAPWDDGEDHLDETAAPTKAWAACTHFDDLVPESAEEICCEWFVNAVVGRPLGAIVYADGLDRPVGNAQAVAQDGGIYIALTEHCLPTAVHAIDDPSRLRLVVLLAGSAPIGS